MQMPPLPGTSAESRAELESAAAEARAGIARDGDGAIVDLRGAAHLTSASPELQRDSDKLAIYVGEGRLVTLE
ncbi:hypothetical protein AB4Z46_31255 [Variovorax sp. M-6]|uniref:hypothetical protein n=1 Tax=Variovorax sp. M-6 TaxID=3233041 RepID=UPI003F9A41F0